MFNAVVLHRPPTQDAVEAGNLMPFVKTDAHSNEAHTCRDYRGLTADDTG